MRRLIIVHVTKGNRTETAEPFKGWKALRAIRKAHRALDHAKIERCTSTVNPC